MQTIGERLEEARKRKGVSIREAAEATKIRGDYLQKFESNQFDLGLAELYVRGFLHSYAQFLKLPAEKIVNDFNGLGLAANGRPRAPSREVYGRMDLSVASAEEAAASEAASPAPDAAPAPARRNPASFTRGGGTLPAGPAIDPNLVVKGGLILIGLVVLALAIWGIRSVTGGSHAKPSVSQASAVQAAPEPTITIIANDTVRLKLVQEFDNKVLLPDTTMAPGESRTLPKKGPCLLTATALENVDIETNGTRQSLKAQGFHGYDRVRIP